jgi:ATP-dependent RNA helicase DDX21
MPSIDVSDYVLETPKDKKEKKMKKSKKENELTDSPISEKKSSKKESKLKKRKALDMEPDEDRSETSSELGEPVNLKPNGELVDKAKKKSKKAKVDEQEEEEKSVPKRIEDDPNAVSKFRISAPLRAKLKEKGIEALFTIQAMTFDTILDGSDLVGRARTGQVIN